MKELIILKDVIKKYDTKLILDKINLTINYGETLFIKGTNGSGKSTLLKIIAGLSSVSSGKRLILHENFKSSIAYVPDNFPKLPLTSMEYLNYMGKIHGLSKESISKKVHTLFDLFNMPTKFLNTKIKDLSKGSIQKIGLIQAMLVTPTLLVLDEPFAGLDKDSREELIKLLQTLHNNKTAIIFTNHETEYNRFSIDNTIEITNGKMKLITSNSDNTLYDVIKFTLDNSLNLEFIKNSEGIIDVTFVKPYYIAKIQGNCSNKLLCDIIKVGGNIYFFEKNCDNKLFKGAINDDY